MIFCDTDNSNLPVRCGRGKCHYLIPVERNKDDALVWAERQVEKQNTNECIHRFKYRSMNGSNDTPPCVKIAHIDSNLDITEAAVRSMLIILFCAATWS